MENEKEVGYSSSSSLTNYLFGAKESDKSPASSGTISSLFPPPSAVGMRASVAEQTAYRSKYYMAYLAGNRAEDASRYEEGGCYCSLKKDGNPIFQHKTNPDPLSSSIYYGCREDTFVDFVNAPNPVSYEDVKKGGVGEDKNGDDAKFASRDNLWEGSLYY